MRGLWAPGLGANAAAAALSRGIGMGCYPTVRDWLVGPRRTKSGSVMFGAGLLSGGFGYGLSTPAWQLKTRLQAGLETGVLYRHSLDGVRQIIRNNGVAALYRGCLPLVVRGALMNAGNTLGYDGAKTASLSRGLLPEGPALHVVSRVERWVRL